MDENRPQDEVIIRYAVIHASDGEVNKILFRTFGKYRVNGKKSIENKNDLIGMFHCLPVVEKNLFLEIDLKHCVNRSLFYSEQIFGLGISTTLNLCSGIVECTFPEFEAPQVSRRGLYIN